jgi:N-acetylmuramoyl-L-alanine amidase
MRHPAALCLLALATLTGLVSRHVDSQTVAPGTAAKPLPPALPALPPAPAFVPLNRMTILIDPGHGGIDSGSRKGASHQEKDVTLALAFKLRSLLGARGFTVILTRDADATPPNAAGQPFTLDDRASLANHAHPAACLFLHATGSGTGVHLYSSELDPVDGVPQNVPWLLAQAPWVQQSRLLERQLASALTKAGIALVNSSASVRPVDSLTCPALVVELAPQSDDPDSINYAAYQQSVAQAIAAALVFWPNQVQPPFRLPAPSLSDSGAQP